MITNGYNLPAHYVIHTVGPIISGILTKKDEDLLASCYKECLTLASNHNLTSIAFPCISTGVFRFPQDTGMAGYMQRYISSKDHFQCL
nr:macro domain-containing protein [uncultured Sharpea sp.]